MGGMRNARTAHAARPTALLSAVATLLAALFVCLGQADTGPGAARDHGTHRGNGGSAVSSSPAGGHTVGTTRTVAPAESATAYSCPYDRGDCAIYPHLGPAVLTAQTQDAPPAAAGLPRGAVPDRVAGGPPRTGALPRAPDLHALQVLRT
ncbi:hypothetical protein OTC26_004635 [Streptomyces tirandamycinicus]|uniref:hypothetical protein n=1 Tax=Streptomyces tirandamycinicus TaxID=2174846 RepID=UPI00226E311F|nr:hypothetical protein [Streptomyces tirandamycinicus]MCY0984744.1 hypothetical protein [Streptomyces tirandamycinicus]